MKTLQSSYWSYLSKSSQSAYRNQPLLGSVIDELIIWLQDSGYTPKSIHQILKAYRQLICWLQRQHGADLTKMTQLDLIAARKWFRVRNRNLAAATRSLSRFFRERNLIPEGQEHPLTASERLIQDHGLYLRDIRGLAEATVCCHLNSLRFFLLYLKLDEVSDVIQTLKIEQIEGYLRKMSCTNNRFSLQHIVATVRCFLRNQHAQGILQQPLHQQIDTPRTYRLEQLPRSLPWDQVVKLLLSIDRSKPYGLRDFTILYLAARYGLRCSELVGITLDHIDWKAGTIKVPQSKIRQMLLLPLTDEAGTVIAEYLKKGRSPGRHRELFLRQRAPSGALAPTAVHDILENRIRHSGLDLPIFGPHALRHSFAIHLLRRGVPMNHIGDALGHRDCESTSVYLRLAIEDLREVGLPLPKTTKPAAIAADWMKRLPRIRKRKCQSPLLASDFGSYLAPSLSSYLAIRRALGRGFTKEGMILRRWDDFLQRNFPTAHEMHPDMFHRWEQTLTHLTATVRRHHLRVVRNFLMFLARNNPYTYLPDLATFPNPDPHQPPRLITSEEMARVLATANQLPASHSNPIRSQTIHLALVLLFCCGLRRGELLRLKLRHFDSTEALLHIEKTKFHKSRLVPLEPSVAEVLQNYLELRRCYRLPMLPDSPILHSKRRPAPNNTYSAVALANNWQCLCLAAQVIDQRGRPPRIHDIRHSFAVTALHQWYQKGVEIQSKLPQLSTYMGHVSPVSTHHYLHLTPDLRNAASDRFHEFVMDILVQGDQK